jgi:hypothetical protein
LWIPSSTGPDVCGKAKTLEWASIGLTQKEDRIPPMNAGARASGLWRPSCLRWLVALLPLLPAVLLGWLMVRFSVDVPFIDEWSLVSDIDAYMSGTWTWHEILRSHNGHRIAVPRLILVPLAALTGWDTRAPLVLSFSLALLLGWMLVRGLGPGLAGIPPATRVFVLLLGSTALFSLNQHGNWLSGFMMTSFLGMASLVAVASLLSTERPSTRRLLVAAGLAVVASYSHGPGLLAFPVGALLLALGSVSRNRWALLAWSALGVAVWALYLIPIPGDVNEMGVPYVLVNPPGWAYYTLSVLGAPVAFGGSPYLSADPGLGFVAGLAGVLVALAFTLWAFSRSGFRAQWTRFATGLVFLSLGSAALTGLARGDNGPLAAYATRYVTWSTPFWLVLTLCLARAAFAAESGRAFWGMRWAARFGLAALAVAIPWCSMQPLPPLRSRAEGLSRAAEGLYFGGPESFLAVLQPGVEQVTAGRPIMMRRRLSVFRRFFPPLLTSTSPLDDFAHRVEVLGPLALGEGEATSVLVRVTNLSGSPWPHLGEDVAGSHAVLLRSRWRNRDGFALDGPRARLSSDLAPGTSAVLRLCIVPPQRGRYRLEIGLVQEDVAWFSDHAQGAWQRKVDVSPLPFARVRLPASRFMTSLGQGACP